MKITDNSSAEKAHCAFSHKNTAQSSALDPHNIKTWIPPEHCLGFFKRDAGGKEIRSQLTSVALPSHGKLRVRNAMSVRCRFVVTLAFASGIALSVLSGGKAYAESGLLLYTPNNGSGNVSVYTTNADGTLASTSTLAVGNGPAYAAVRGDQAFAYVTNNTDNTLSVIDTKTNTVVQTVATGGGPRGVAVSPDGKLVYVANNTIGINTVSVFSADALTGQLSLSTTISTGAGSNPRQVVFNQDGSRAYIANQANGSVSIVNTTTNAIIGTVNTGGQLLAMAINPAGTRVYATSATNVVFVIDTASQSVIASPATGGNPFGVAVSPDGAYYYVTNNNDFNIRQYDAASNTQIGAPVATGFNPQAFAISPDGNYMYIAQRGTDNNVRIFSVAVGTGALTFNSTIAAGTAPASVGICGNGNAMLASGGTFIANTAGALGCAGSSAAFTGGTLKINGTGLNIATAMTLGSAGGTIDTNGNSATISSIIGGAGSLTKSGTGTLTLSGANTYTGATAVNAGTVQASAANVFGSNSAMTVASGAVLDLNSFNQTLGSLAGAGNVTLGSATLTAGGNNSSTIFSGVLSGTGGLVKAGSGTLTLSGANSYTGATAVNAGTLQAGATNVFGNNSAVTVASGAVLGLNSFNQTLGALSGAGNVTLGSATLTAGGNNSSTTFSGVLSGTGGLTKTGSGTLTLSGANTYTGATAINAGTLQAGATNVFGNNSAVTVASGAVLGLNSFNQTLGALSGAGNVTLGSATLTAGGNNSSTTFSGVLSGAGGLTKTGSGTLTLSGANTYTGAMAVNAGTLQAGAANVFGNNSAVTVASGAVLDLNSFSQTLGALSGAGNATLGAATLTAGGNNSSTTFSGVLSGTGGLVKAGSGTLTLSGANIYTGAMSVNAGTLQAGAANAFGNNSAVTVASGAVLGLNSFNQTLGALSGAGNATLGAATLTAGGNNSSTTFSGVLSGTGGLVKAGSGLLILNGANSYSGATTVAAGTLEIGDINTPGGSIANNVTVNAAGTLRGHGSITGDVINSGSIMPGGSIGTLTVNGNVLFNPGSVFSVELSPSQTSLLNVTGGHTAALGGSVQVLAETGDYDFNTRYTILSATGGVSGRFGGVTSNLAFLTPNLSYDANNVFLNLVRNDVSFSAVAAAPNQRAIGGALNIVGSNDNLRTLLNPIVRLSAAQARSAYDSLSGVQNSYTQTLAIQQSQQFQKVLFDRLNGNSLSQDRDGSMPLAVGLTQGSLLTYNGADWLQFLTGRSLGVAKGQGADKKERGLWLRGFGGFGDIKASANASGADYQSGGMALGLDGELNAKATVGSAFGYTRTNGYTAGGNLDMDSFQGAAYGSWRDAGYYLNGMAGLGYHNADARRQVIAGNINAQAASGHNIWTGTAAAEAGRNFTIRTATVTPFAGLAYTGLGGNGFTENGAGAANLRVGDEKQHSLQSSLGARLSRAWKTDGGMEIRPGVEAAYVHQYLDNVSRLNTRFNAAPDAGFIVEGPGLDRNRARLGAGVAAQLTKTAQLNVSYNGDIAGSDQHHSFAATLKMQW